MRRALPFLLLALLGAVTALLWWPEVPRSRPSDSIPSPSRSGAAVLGPGTASGEAAADALPPTEADQSRNPLVNEPADAATESAADAARPSLLLHLRDGSGRPVSGLHARIHHLTMLTLPLLADSEDLWADPHPLEIPELDELRSGEDGFLFTGLPAGTHLRLELSGPHWQPRKWTLAPLAAGERRELGPFVLAPGHWLHGRLIDLENQPVDRAELRLLPPDDGLPNDYETPLAEAVSAADGSWSLEGIPDGSFRLVVSAPGFLPPDPRPVRFPPGSPDLDWEIRLRRGGSLRGVVLDQESGAPLPEARLLLLRRPPLSIFSPFDRSWVEGEDEVLDRGQPVDAEGRFQVSGIVGDGRDLLIAAAPGHADQRLDPVRPGSAVELRLPRRAELRGGLRTPSGQPAVGAAIWAYDSNSGPVEASQPVRQTQTDDHGTFDFPDLDPGSYTLVAWSAAGQTRRTVVLDASLPSLDLRLEGGPGLRLRVLDAQRQPVEGADVNLRESRTALTEDRGVAFELSPTQFAKTFGQRVWWSQSDAQGRVHFANLQGDFEVEVRAPGMLAQGFSIALSGGSDREEEVILQVAASLRIRAVDDQGEPIADLGLLLRPLDGSSPDGLKRSTDSAGLASWPELRGCRYALLRDLEGLQTDPTLLDLELRPGEVRREEIRIEDLAFVTVQVLRGGRPAPGALVGTLGHRYQDSDPDPHAMLRADGRGRRRLPPAPPGDYRLLARASAASPVVSKPVHLLPGSQTLRIELGSGSLHGRVGGPSGPVVGARVQLIPVGAARKDQIYGFSVVDENGHGSSYTLSDNASGARTRTDAEGSYLFSNLAAGQYFLRILDPDYLPYESPPLTLDGTSLRDLDLIQLQRGSFLRGRILGLGITADDPDHGYASLEPLPRKGEDHPSGHPRYCLLDEKGRYAFENLPPGHYRLQVSGPQGKTLSTEVEIGTKGRVFDLKLR